MGKKTKQTILSQKYSQRDAFFSRVYEMMKEDQDIVIIVADMSTPVFDKVRKEFPDRFINVGIAEQNAILIASGLAKQGKKVFVYAIASFMILRCFEQIRVENSIMGIPITIVGVGAGFSYDDSGPTHHLFEDIAMMRLLPNMTIHSITDNYMARKVAEESIEMETPNYVRLERHVEPDIYSDNLDLSQGINELIKGKDAYLISTGIMSRQSLQLSKAFEKKKISLGVIDIHRIPCDEQTLIGLVKNVPSLVTLEENFLPGSLGSYVLEILSDNGLNNDVKRFGVSNGWVYRYGGREDNRKYHGIDEKTLINEIEKFIIKL